MFENCLTCSTSENLLLLREHDWKVLDYVLFPYLDKSHLEDLKANCTVKVCSKCQYSMQTINNFRTMALANYMVLFKIWEKQNLAAEPRIEEIKIKQEFIDTDSPKPEQIEVNVDDVKTEPCYSGNMDDNRKMGRNNQTPIMLNNILQNMYVTKVPAPRTIHVEVPEHLKPFEVQTNTSAGPSVRVYTHCTKTKPEENSNKYLNNINRLDPSRIPHELIPQLLRDLLPKAHKKILGIQNGTDVMDMLEKAQVSDDGKRDSSLEMILLRKLNELKSDFTNLPGVRGTLTSLPLECPLCRRELVSLINLKKHLKKGHKKINHCVPCDKWFDDQQSLRDHIKNSIEHAPFRKRLTCDYCGDKFMSKTPLREHIEVKHTKRNRCKQCNKIFRKAGDLQRHKDSVHDKKRLPKDKICDHCGRGFTTLRILNIHVRTHTGERPLNCSHCPATFAHPAALYTHNKLKHKTEPKESTSRKKRKNE